MSPLEASERALLEVIRRHGSEIQLVTANGWVIVLQANVGETRTQQVQAGSAGLPLTVVQTRDFLVETALLNAQEITRGCRIRFAGHEYQPASPGGQPLARDSGRFGLVTRICTVRV